MPLHQPPGVDMSRSAFTIKAAGCYLLILGLVLILVPNLLLALFRMPPTQEVWIRVLGVAVFNFGLGYWAAARSESVEFFRMSVYGRPTVLLCFAAFVLLGLASPMLLLFGVVEVAGALWTWLALRSEHRAGLRLYPNTRIDPKFSSKFNSRM
jgi:hypothetical protein